MIFKFILIMSLGLVAFSSNASQEKLIQDIEDLRNSLATTDPQRGHLALRLADLSADYAFALLREVGKEDQAARYRRKAIELYQFVLSGNEKINVSRDMRLKIQFQLSRLHRDSGSLNQAEKIWEALAAQTDRDDLQREAALSIAELADARNQLEKAYAYYTKTIELCRGGDLCAFSRHKRAWILRHQGKLPLAVKDLQAALYDSKSQLREEALKDLTVFLASDGSNGSSAISILDEIARKTSRPSIILELGRAYFSSGNKVAGIQAYKTYVSRKPPLSERVVLQIRLLEEYYGLRDWDQFEDIFSQLLQINKPLETVVTDRGDVTESEKILRRLAVQLDGERRTRKETIPTFQKTVILYLTYFPRSQEKMTMIQGWIAAAESDEQKLTQLNHWIDESGSDFQPSEIVLLREKRAAIAQNLKKYDIVIDESRKLADFYSAQKKHNESVRKFRYHEAHAYYSQKMNDAALPLFKELAVGSDIYAIQSQNLALDILNQKKNFAALVLQAETWLLDPSKSKNSKLTKELDEMRKVMYQAQFELAVLQSESPEAPHALKTFLDFCERGVLRPKSCDNGFSLATKLKNQDAIIKILTFKKDDKSLASEYELSGYFGDAARVQEKFINLDSSLPSFIKVALLYELEGNVSKAQEILKRSLKSKSFREKNEKAEALLIRTLRDLNLISGDLLMLQWSSDVRNFLANYLEENGKSTKETRSLILKSEKNIGSSWVRLKMETFNAKIDEQSKIKFYGARSQSLFQKRLKLLQELSQFGEKLASQLNDKASRVAVLKQLGDSYQNLANEILQSPMPPEVTAEDKAAIQGALAQMAEPIEEKAKAYQSLVQQEESKAVVAEPSMIESKPVAHQEMRQRTKLALESLRVDPMNKAVIQALRDAYKSAGHDRLAAYFEGRIQSGGSL